MIASSHTALEAALALNEWGATPIPIRERSKEPNHATLIATRGRSSWRADLAERSIDAEEIRTWFEADPRTGIGIITGGPRKLVVVDVDDPRVRLQHPATPCVRSGGGGIYIYTTSQDPRSRKLAGVDLKGQGGYVVAPPSTHESGNPYEWACGLDDADLIDLSEVRGLPEKPSGGRAVGRDIHCLRPSPSTGTGDELAKVEPAVERMLLALGIVARIGAPFRCVLPGHDDRRASASVFRCRDGVFRYRCWAACCGPEWLTLAEVRAARNAGAFVPLPAPVAVAVVSAPRPGAG